MNFELTAEECFRARVALLERRNQCNADAQVTRDPVYAARLRDCAKELEALVMKLQPQ